LTALYRIEPLASTQDRSAFRCGNDRIDRFFQNVVSQDIRRNYARCFVCIEAESQALVGFYTLSAQSVDLGDIPAEMAKKLPRYPRIPCVLMGWLAVDSRFARRGIGSLLLADALDRVVRSDIGAYAVLVDPIDEAASEFYRHHAFVSLGPENTRLVLPLATWRALAAP
jgi:GNAT superfamily N-acetyltransferase